jgi:hypothetical protein
MKLRRRPNHSALHFVGEGFHLLEAVEALEGETERSTTSAVLVDYHAATYCEKRVSLTVMCVFVKSMVERLATRGGTTEPGAANIISFTEECIGTPRESGLPACFPPKPLVHIRPIVACLVVVLMD